MNIKKNYFFFIVLITYSCSLYSAAAAKTPSEAILLKGKYINCPLEIEVTISSVDTIESLKETGFIVNKEGEKQKTLAKSVAAKATPAIAGKLLEYGYLRPCYFRDKVIKDIADKEVKELLRTKKEKWRDLLKKKVEAALHKKNKQLKEAPAGKRTKSSKKKPIRNVPCCAICHKDFRLSHLAKYNAMKEPHREERRFYQCKHGYDCFHPQCIKTWKEQTSPYNYNFFNPAPLCPICNAKPKKQK